MVRRTAIRVLLALVCVSAIAPASEAEESTTAADWQEDLDHLAKTIRKKHKSPFHRVTKEDFDREVAELRDEIPQLATHEILIGLVRIGAMIGDGHTAVRPYDRFEVCALKLFWFGEDLRVTAVAPEHAEILGWKVTRIGDVPIDEAARAVNSLIPQGENPYFVFGWNGYWLKTPKALHALGVIESPDRASFTFQNRSGLERTIELHSVSNDEYGSMEWASVYDPRPAFMQTQEEAIRVMELRDGEVLYVAFRSYPKRKEVKQISKKIREQISKEGIDRLVIDFRGNGGGDFNKGLHMIEEIRKTKIQDHGTVYALTDRWTFSAAMSNAAHCRDQLGAILVGEPPGERPNGYAENHGFTLPNSGVAASCSVRYYEFQDEDTPTLKLDRSIPPDLEAWAEGRDPVLEWVLSQ